MRAGIRLAISGLVLASIIVSAIGVHFLWWRTAEANSRALADVINAQIDSSVERELATITSEARAAHTAIRTLFVQHVLETREADKQASTVFLFGHAPQLDDVIATALGSKKHLTALKKAGVAFVELKRLSPPIGELVWLATPKLLRRAGK